jgi:hypothetical protein
MSPVRAANTGRENKQAIKTPASICRIVRFMDTASVELIVIKWRKMMKRIGWFGPSCYSFLTLIMNLTPRATKQSEFQG